MVRVVVMWLGLVVGVVGWWGCVVEKWCLVLWDVYYGGFVGWVGVFGL